MWSSCPSAACSTEGRPISAPGRTLRLRRPGRRAAFGLAGLGVLGVCAAQAAPDGWSLSGSLSERVSVVSNPGLSTTGSSTDIQAATRLSLNAIKATGRSSLNFDAAVSPVLARSTPEDPIGFLTPSAGMGLTLNGKRTTYNAFLRGSLSSTAFIDQLFGLDPQGNPDPNNSTLVTGTATQAVYSAGAGLNWTPTRADSFSLDVSAARVDFFEGSTSLVPNTNLSLSGSWSRVLTKRWTGNLDARLGWFTAQSATDPQSVFLTTSAGVTYAPLRNFSITGSLGVAYSLTEQNLLPLPGSPRITDTVISGTGALSLSYTPPIKDLTVTFSLSQDLQPSSLGSLQNTTALNAGATYAINRASTLGVNARVQLQADLGNSFGLGNGVLALRLGPSYTYQLARNTSFQMGYALDYTDVPGSGDALSHSVFVGLTHNFNLLQ